MCMMDMDNKCDTDEYVIMVLLDELCQKVVESDERLWLPNSSEGIDSMRNSLADCSMETQYFEIINEANSEVNNKGIAIVDQSTPVAVESNDAMVIENIITETILSNIENSANKLSSNSATTITSIPETILSGFSEASSNATNIDVCQNVTEMDSTTENNVSEIKIDDASQVSDSQIPFDMDRVSTFDNLVYGTDLLNNDNSTKKSENVSAIVCTPETACSGVSNVSSDATKLDVSHDQLIQNVSSTDFINQNTEDNISIVSESQRSSKTLVHKLIGESNHYGLGNYFKGCKWAPDGLCYMANTNDNHVRIFNTPLKCLRSDFASIETPLELEDCLRVQEPGLVYDYCWWPMMNSQAPATCCFATSAVNQPVHLWDAFHGTLRASYIALDHVQEITAAYSLCFSNDGRQLLCGYKKDVCLFYTDRPGAHYERWPTMKKKQKKSQNNIISCLEFCPDDSMFACGAYDGSVGIYSPTNGHLLDFTAAHNTGITNLKFSKDGYRLYTGVRNGKSVKCWDIRNIKNVVFDVKRIVSTNQRIYFDIIYDSTKQNELALVSGSTNGFVSMWDIYDTIAKSCEAFELQTMDINASYSFKAHEDCVNGCSVHPFLPILATASGQRLYPELCDSDDEDVGNLLKIVDSGENKVKLWHLYNEESS